jgi:hypothetical protein
MLDPGANLVPEPECITVPVLLRQKVTVPAAPVTQHWNESQGMIFRQIRAVSTPELLGFRGQLMEADLTVVVGIWTTVFTSLIQSTM